MVCCAVQIIPTEAVRVASRTVDVCTGASELVPESACERHRWVETGFIVITVQRREHSVVLNIEGSPSRSVPGEPVERHPVVGRLAADGKRAVFVPVPQRVVEALQVESDAVLESVRQLEQPVITEPVVTARVAESDLELRPRPVEEGRSVDVLLDENVSAFCIINFVLHCKQTASLICMS